jgi:glutamate-1-semialdehyde 2,1-aminomutase
VAVQPLPAEQVERTRAEIVGRYRELTPASAAAYARAARTLAGGTTGNLRHFHPYPLFFGGGQGSRMVDLDGRAHLDCFLCNGPLLLGHRPAAVVDAVHARAGMGSLVVNPLLAVEASEALQRVLPHAERVRFLNSGTEAVMTAVRLARAATGKPRIVKFLGHYHGQDDQFLVGLDPSGRPFGSGIPPSAYSHVALVRYGDPAALDAALAAHDDVAAVLLDPAMHSGGLWGSTTQFLREVRELTRRRRVVLIFDEVITGFRLAAGGAAAFHGVAPDLATYAKALGAGEKVAAVVGSEALMRPLDPDRPSGVPGVFQSGTANDGTAGLAAAAAAVARYEELQASGEYGRLHARGARLADGLRAAFRAAGVPHHVNQLGPMLQLFLTNREPGFESFGDVPAWPLMLLYLALINEGVLLSLPTSNHVYLSFAHSDEDIDGAVAAADRVLRRYDFAGLVAAAGR